MHSRHVGFHIVQAVEGDPRDWVYLRRFILAVISSAPIYFWATCRCDRSGAGCPYVTLNICKKRGRQLSMAKALRALVLAAGDLSRHAAIAVCGREFGC